MAPTLVRILFRPVNEQSSSEWIFLLKNDCFSLILSQQSLARLPFCLLVYVYIAKINTPVGGWQSHIENRYTSNNHYY
jgi:hypothetical protein